MSLTEPGNERSACGKSRTGAAVIAMVLALSHILIVQSPASAAHEIRVPMGTLTNFSVLANSLITDTGGTTTFADGVGVWPGNSVVGISDGDQASGGIHLGDPVAQQAQSDFSLAYSYSAAQSPSVIAAELGGQTLVAGVYGPAGGGTALSLGTTLTFDAEGDKNAIFIVQTAGAFNSTATISAIVLANGAQACNVFFQVGGAVTLGAASSFTGTMLAGGAITVGAGVDFYGRAFTGLGDMTLSSNVFHEPTCDGTTVTPTHGLVTTEAAISDTFTVALNSQPSASVTIGVSSSDTTEGTVDQSLLTFTTVNWATPQTVTVTGVDDSVVDGAVGYTVVLAPAIGGGYTGTDPADVEVTNSDNDAVGITVAPFAGLVTTEAGGIATFTVVLDSQPSAEVTIGVSSSDTSEGTASASSLVFTTLNWATPQTVTVTGVNDSIDDGDVAYSVVLAAATGGDYSGIDPVDVGVTNTDNDTVGVTVTPTASPLVTAEAGGTGTFTVVLNTQPTGPVTIAVSSDDLTEGTVSTASLTFTTLNWQTPQTVTVTGIDDLVDDGDVLYAVVLATAVGGGYDAVNPADVAMSNTDNDTSGGGGGGGGVVPPLTGLVDTSAACPDSIATSGFADLSVLDETTIQAIDCIVHYGISNGTTDVTFTPSGTVTRWQMAIFLIRQIQVHGVTLPTAIDQGFTDVGGFDQETRDAINQLAQLGITIGTGGGTFSPGEGVARWEMALFLVRFLGVAGMPLPTLATAGTFNDLAQMDSETVTAIDQLVALGVAAGTSTTTFEPSNDVLRWQMALFLTRVMALDGIVPS